MRGLVPLDHVQRPPADLPRLHRRLAVFGDILARRGVVVEPVDALGDSGAEHLVRERPVDQDVGRGVVGDRAVGGGGAEAEGRENGAVYSLICVGCINGILGLTTSWWFAVL